MTFQTIAQEIAQTPFFEACRTADQICTRIKMVGEDAIWKFEDGSKLTSHITTNSLEVL